MTGTEFQDLQEALLYVFLPSIQWWFVMFTSLGVLGGIGVVWMMLIRALTRLGF